MKNHNLTKELLNFINESPTAFHATNISAKILSEPGFREIKENEKWELEKNGRYYLVRNNSSLIAFEIGENFNKYGFRIIGTHSDSPNFKLKPGNVITTEDGYVKLNTECYGGVILSTWFDRPLSIAGRVMLKDKNSDRCIEKLININRPILMIPSLCIHFNREVNDGYAFNKQIDLLPLLCLAKEGIKKQDYILNILVNELEDISTQDILDYDLFLYGHEQGYTMGLENEFISASRLDNLWMMFTGIHSIINSDASTATKVFVAFDNEEVGSTTSEGANSMYLMHILNRISMNFGLSFEDTQIALANSVAISADCAHAVHPNYGNKHDPVNRPILGGGLAIKYSANQRYGTNAYTAATFIQMCQSFNIPYQKYVNRSDIIGGSTIGPAMSSLSSIQTLDVGIPILAMHSIREFGCVSDNNNAIQAFLKFYSC